MKHKHKKIIIILALLIIASFVLYFYARVFYKAHVSNLVLTKSAALSIGKRVITSFITMSIAAALVTVVSLLFQTINNNKILTPSILGFDSIFTASQAILIFLSNQNALMQTLFNNSYLNFIISASLMVIVSVSMYSFIVFKNKNSIYLLLFFGLVVSSVVRSITNYIEVLLNPQEFQQFKAATTVTLTNMNTQLIYPSILFMILLIFKVYKNKSELDVMLLDQDHAISLGVAYHNRVKKYLIMISFAMAISTALVGLLTFLGLIAVPIARELASDYQHAPLFIVSSLLAVFLIVFGQAVVELLRYATPVSVIINLLGGIYVIYLIIRGNRI